MPLEASTSTSPLLCGPVPSLSEPGGQWYNWSWDVGALGHKGSGGMCPVPAASTGGQEQMGRAQVGPWRKHGELYPTTTSSKFPTTSYGMWTVLVMEAVEYGGGSLRPPAPAGSKVKPPTPNAALLWAPGYNLEVPFLVTQR